MTSYLTPEDRLAELGIALPEPPAPAAAYVPTARTGDLLFVAGQVPKAGGEMVATGRLGAEVQLETGQRCARQCAITVLAQIKAATGQLRHVHRLVKVTVFVASADGFAEQHLVANGASELFGDVLGEEGRHARSAVGVAALPMGAPVEVDAVAEVA
jgi:enamine deaminase RidA (YjgF/YER057c/UK114 family)